MKVLLREPEVCKECGKVYLSLWPLKWCYEHLGLECIEASGVALRSGLKDQDP